MHPRAFRWYGVITLFVIVAISYIDRINIAVLITDAAFLQHIGIAPSDRVSQGLLATAFMVGYGVSAFVLTPFCAALFGVRKSLVFGLIITAVGCQEGFSTGAGAEEVGRSTTSAVVTSIFMVILVDLVFTALFYVTSRG